MSEDQATKRCAGCQLVKATILFPRNKASPDGFASRCKECHCRKVAEWRKNNPEKVQEAERLRYAADPERAKRKVLLWRKSNPAEFRAYQAEWRRQHRDEQNQKRNARYAQDPEKYRGARKAYVSRHRKKISADRAARYQRDKVKSRSQFAAWLKKNPHKNRQKASERRAIVRGCSVTERRNIEAFYKLVHQSESMACHWCGCKVKRGNRHVDHIVPLSRGGRHAVDNLCCACASCNLRKHNKLPAEFTGQHELFA